MTFNSGETSKTFTFSATQDEVDDDDERREGGVRVRCRDRVSEGRQDETTVIIDDDDNPHVTVEFTQDEYTVVEGSNVGVRVRLSADPERTVSIPITATNQDGATSADYTVPASVGFDAGETEKTFTFAATDDDEEDFGESVKLSFGTTLPDRITRSGTRGDDHQHLAVHRPGLQRRPAVRRRQFCRPHRIGLGLERAHLQGELGPGFQH